jgi:hypothetical protein
VAGEPVQTGAVMRYAAAILARAGLADHEVVGVSRLRRGSKKGVFRLACADGFSAVLYIWSHAEDYWPASPGGADGVFAHATGLDLFGTCAARLSSAQVRVPRVYLLDDSHRVYPADLALVEDVRGGTLEELLAADPEAAEPVVERLGAILTAMRGQRADHFGRVGDGSRLLDEWVTCEQVVLDRALRHLGRAADRVPRLAEARLRLDETLRSLAAAVRPRTAYSLIHGELGPDHVLLDERRQPVIIDIEGAMFFDAEWEHAFLRLRFGSFYRRLRAPGLDEQRIQFYSLALYLSLVEGPLRLLDGSYPDRDEMLAIADANAERALKMAGTPQG